MLDEPLMMYSYVREELFPVRAVSTLYSATLTLFSLSMKLNQPHDGYSNTSKT